jgi:hypothetical protein
MLSGQAARGRSGENAEDETAVPAGVPDRGGADAESRSADTEAPRGRAGVFGADAAELAASDEADRGERQNVLTSEERKRLRELERENKVCGRSARS